MEPTAVLVGAFKIQISKTVIGPVGTVPQCERMGRSTVEPYVKNVGDLIVIIRINDPVQEPRLCSVLVPCICAFDLKCIYDPRIHVCVLQKEVSVRWQRANFGKASQRHTPSALTRQHPIGALFDHRMQTVAALLWGPSDQLVDRSQRTFADRRAVGVLPIANCLINRGKPLRCITEDDRSFRTPRMRIAVLDLTTCKQFTHLRQGSHHSRVGVTFPRVIFVLFVGLVAQNSLAAKQRKITTERPVFGHVIGDNLFEHAQIAVQFKLVHAVTWRTMHKPCTIFVRYKWGRAEIAGCVPFAIAAFDTRQWMCQLQTRQIACISDAFERFNLRFGQTSFGQFISQQQLIANFDPVVFGGVGHFVDAIGNIRVIHDALVGRDSPRCCCPDHNVSASQRTVAQHREADPDCKAFFVVIFDLCFGQGGLFHR